MNRTDLIRENRLRYNARRQGFRLVRRMRTAERTDAWTGFASPPRVPRYWLVRSDDSKVGGPAGLSMEQAEEYLEIETPARK